MRNLIISVIVIVFAASVWAQVPTFFNAPKKPVMNTATTGAQTVVSPSDFDSKVAQIAAEKEKAYQEKLKKQISDIPPPQIVAVPSTPAPSTPGTQPAQGMTPPPPSPPPAEKIVVTPAGSPPLPSTPREVYTGFGASPSGTTGAAPSSTAPQPKSGGGWNIKY